MTAARTFRRRRIPSLCLRKTTRQAVVRLDGRDVYCGVYGKLGKKTTA